MFSYRHSFRAWQAKRRLSSEVAVAAARCAVEMLEGRRLLAASLTVENLDIIPGYERMIFNKIGTLDEETPNTVKDKGILRLRNAGDETLTLSNLSISGPFEVVGEFPASIQPGGSANVTVQFTATAPPTFTYNQTAGNSNPRDGGSYIGSLKFDTNDPSNATYQETLAGWYQRFSEKNNEPSLQTMINLLMDYPTDLAPARTVLLSQGDEPKYYGEEIVSAYWKRVDPTKNVGVRQIAAFHGQGDAVPVSWYVKGGGVNQLFRHDGAASQSFLPPIQGGTTAAFGSFSTSSQFGFRVDKSYSDDSLNPRPEYGGGHEVRFYPVRDHFGNALANTYFMVQDYSIPVGGFPPNFDFQDNIYIVTNVAPVSGDSVPPTIPTVPPTVPPEVPPPVPPEEPPVDPPTVPPEVPPTVPPEEPPAVPPPPVGGVDPLFPTIALTTGAVEVTEGIKGKSPLLLTVSLDKAVNWQTRVRFAVADGEAVRRVDYAGKASGIVKIGVGKTSKTIKLFVKGDRVAEANKTFSVTLTDPANATLGNAQATVTVVDNGQGGTGTSSEGEQLPVVSITPAAPLLAEGNSKTQLYTFNVTLDRTPTKKVKLKYATADGLAVVGDDYKRKAGSLSFAAGGPTTKTITVAVKGDADVEQDEDFVINLSAITNGVFGTSSIQGVIQNDDV